MGHNPSDHLIFLTLRVGKLLRCRMLELIARELQIEVPGHCIGVLADLYTEDGQRQQDLAISSINDKSNITKMVSRLEEQGFIVRKVDMIDRRSKRIYLTDKSRSFLHEVFRRAEALEEEIVEGLNPDDILTTKSCLQVLYQSLLHAASPCVQAEHPDKLQDKCGSAQHTIK